MVINYNIADATAINGRKSGKRFFLLSLILLFIVAFAFPGIPSPGQADTAIKANLGSHAYGNLPLYFVPNQGQVHEKALFYARTGNYTLWITKEGLVFDSLKRENGNSNKSKRDVSRLFFVNAGKNLQLIPAEPSPHKISYFIGNDKNNWRSGIPTSKAVLYREVYNHIDLKVYGIEKQVEYDWIVKPGGNVGDIRFRYKDITGTAVSTSGDLEIETNLGKLLHKKPVAYQIIDNRQVPVDSRFKKTGKNTYGLEVGKYDKNRTLIIDPVILEYSTYLGGNKNDEAMDMAVDNEGCAYVTGSTGSSDFPTSISFPDPDTGNTNGKPENKLDVFVAKFTADGSALEYSAYIGAADVKDVGMGIALDSGGNVYVTGITTISNQTAINNFPVTANAFQGTYGGGDSDAFVLKLSPTDGGWILTYSTYLGDQVTEPTDGLGSDEGHSIAADGNGHVYVTGMTDSKFFPFKNGFDDTYAANPDNENQNKPDAFLTRINTNAGGTASLIYSTYLGGLSHDAGRDIALAANGIVYITGETANDPFPPSSASAPAAAGKGNGNSGKDAKAQVNNSPNLTNAFVVKINTGIAGTAGLMYHTLLGGGMLDEGRGIAVDNSGNIFVTGTTKSNDFPTGSVNGYPYSGGDDAFVVKLIPQITGDYSIGYSSYLGGSGNDSGESIAVDGEGNVYITGITESTDFPHRNSFLDVQLGTILHGVKDAFVARLDTARNNTDTNIFATYLGGNLDEIGNGIAVDGSGYIYITGSTNSTDFPVTPGVFQSTAKGQTDAFVSRLFYNPLLITAPNGGEVWNIEANENITWIYDLPLIPSNTRISLILLKDDVMVGYLNDIDNNEYFNISDSSYTWRVGDYAGGQARPAKGYKIRIITEDKKYLDESDETFEIYGPVVDILSPNGGEEWKHGNTETITWKYQELPDNAVVELELRQNGMVLGSIIDPAAPVKPVLSNESFTWSKVGTYFLPDGTELKAIPGVDYQIYIKTADDAGIAYTDESDNFFTISGFILLTPNGGETWDLGKEYEINWQTVGTFANISIQYSIDGGNVYDYILESDVNSGSLLWSIPWNVLPDGQVQSDLCIIRISDAGLGVTADTSDDMFTIIKPTITVSTPNGPEEWEGETIQTITWNSTGNISTVNIEYSTNGGTDWAAVTSGETNDGSFDWPVPDEPSENCLIKISDADNSDIVYDISDLPFTILKKRTITLTAPNGGEEWEGGSTQTITWNSTGDIPAVNIQYSINGGTNWAAVTSGETNDGSFEWLVPDEPSENCLIKISDANDSDTLFDESDAVFTILKKRTITVLLPNGGEKWESGSTQTITWNSTGDIPNVNIQYSINGGTDWANVTSGETNDGSFDWLVPDGPSENCLIKISDTNDPNTVFDVSDAAFTISEKRAIIVTLPNGGEEWEGGSTQTITWNSTGNIPTVNIHYSINGGADWAAVTSGETNDGSFDWLVPDGPSENCLIKISDTNDPNTVFDVSNAVFTILKKRTITVILPNGGEKWEGGSTQTIIWNSTGNIPTVNIHYSINGGADWAAVASGETNDGSFNWLVPDESSESCLIKISDVNNPNTVFDVSDAVFTILKKRTITVTLPNGGEKWEGGSTQTITWNSTGNIPYVNIQYSINGGTNWLLAAVNKSNDGRFNWLVLDQPSQYCLIKISDVNDPNTVFDVSNALFTILKKRTITVTLPNGGEIWEGGSTQTITWNSTGNIPYVNIQYSINGGSNWLPAAINEPNDGSFNWLVPEQPSQNCLIRISDAGDNVVSDTSDNPFSIQQNRSITVKVPNGFEEWEGGSVQTITWDSSGSIDNVLIQYSIDGGGSWTNVSPGVTPNDGTHSWTVPDTPSTTCLIKISDADDSNVFDTCDNPFTILKKRTIRVISPNGGEIWEVGSKQNVTWTTAGPVSNVKIEYTVNNGGSWTTITSATPNDGVYLWTVPNASSGNCRVRITDTDSPAADKSDNLFTILTPSIKLTSPNGGENWEILTTYNITWTSMGSFNTVKIDYSTDNGSSWTTITSSTPNDGTYAWKTPITTSDQCLVRVSDAADGTPKDQSDANFSITAPGAIIVTRPNGGEFFKPGTKELITWITSGNIRDVKLEYSIDGGTTWTIIHTEYTTSNGQYLWTVPNYQSNQCLIKASDPRGSAWDVSNNYFSIGTAPAVPQIISPAPDTYVPTTTPLLQWTAVSGATQYQVVISYTSVDDEPSPAILRMDLPSSTTQYRVPAGILNPNTTYVWGVKAKNTLGWGGWSSDRNMTIQLSSPWIYSPGGSDVWKLGREYKTKWVPDAGSPLRMELHHEDTGYVGTCLGSIGDDGSRGWIAGDFIDGGFPGGIPQAGKVYFIKLVIKNPDHAVRGYSQTQFDSNKFTITQ